MRHYPLFVDLNGQKVVVAGGGETAIAKLRLLLKSNALILVTAVNPDQQIRAWAATNKLTLIERSPTAADLADARLLYCASDDATQDAAVAAMGRAAGVLVNQVDNLEGSDFLTPAIVDRDPVIVAIGTEGTAPVLARLIKAKTEQMLATNLGTLARLGSRFRQTAAQLASGATRRQFWTEFFDHAGPIALGRGGEAAAVEVLQAGFAAAQAGHKRGGFVSFVGAGPGDPELLTMKARKCLHEADVVLHDRLVDPLVLELARREAEIVEVGKSGYGPSWRQADINRLLTDYAQAGLHVVRLKSGDPSVFGRLDEEILALDAAEIEYQVIAGISAAVAAAAELGVSLTRRRRNSSLKFLTGRDMDNFAEHDWAALAKPGSVAAIYMAGRAAGFLRGRLLMHGADPDTPVTIMENVSRSNQRTIASNLLHLPDDVSAAALDGPAILMFGLSPRSAHVAAGALEHRQTGT